MKRKSPSSNRRPSGNSVALFPFLAVLVCTMGGLIVMMMIITRQAKRQAVETVQTHAAEQRESLQLKAEEAQWRTEQIRESRKKLGEDLVEARLQIGHLEEHSQKLLNELKQRQAEWNDLQQWEKREVKQREQLEAEAARLRQEADAARRDVEAARVAAQQRPKTYSIVPYEGPNGTQRRPIYIECRGDAVIIQPEGIRFTVHDFTGPQGPGNPLASAVRAIREYWVQQRMINPETDGEPYPLLLVRPEGVVAYYAARSALESYEADFGYELIGEDWSLKFPTSDVALTQVLHSTVAHARQLHERLIAAAPRTYGDARPRGPYAGGAGAGMMPETGYPSTGTGGWGSSGTAGGGIGGGSGGVPYGNSGAMGADATGSVPGQAGGSALAIGPKAGGGGSGQASDGSFREMLPDDMIAGEARPGTYENRGAAGGTSRDGGATAGNPGDASAKPVARPEGFVVGQPYENNGAPQTGAGTPLRPGEWIPQEGKPSQAAKPPHEDNAKKRLADTRGRDWGLPKRGSRSVPVTRPIRIECRADRFVVLPEPGLPGQRVIQLGPRTADAIDEFISAIWEQIDSWGIAGRDMYWRPVLRVAVAPDAESRFRDLCALLDASGLEIERR